MLIALLCSTATEAETVLKIDMLVFLQLDVRQYLNYGWLSIQVAFTAMTGLHAIPF